MEHITGLNSLMSFIRTTREDQTLMSKDFNYWSSLEDYPILYALACQYRPDNIVEAGTCNGMSALVYAAYLSFTNTKGAVYTFDAVERHVFYTETNLKSFIHRYVKPFNQAAPEIRNIAHTKVLYFIDGDHSFEGCSSDILTIMPFLKQGDVVIFHDYYDNPVAKAVASFPSFYRKVYDIRSKSGMLVVEV